ncbi:MAG: PEMT/PEM2 family methyltransferase [Bacillota bacterium]
MSHIKKIIHVLFAMSGILIDKLNYIRVMQVMVIAMIFLFYKTVLSYTDFRIALSFFIFAWAVRYIFLFTSFIKGGVAERLKTRFGEEKGFEIYQFFTAIMFFQSTLSFSLLVDKSSLMNLWILRSYQDILIAAGIMISAIGMLVNIWSALIIGIDVYYYKDLFVGRPVSEFKKEGPYKVISNPMYAIGQAGGYGTALMFGSFAGLAGIFLNQVLMYIFYYTVEKPHVIKFFGES